MESETEGICAIEDFNTTLIPVEILPCEDSPQRTRVADTPSIVELGKHLLACAETGDTEMVRDLMCRGAPFTTDWLGVSALHKAAQNNHLETAEVLLRAGISRDARTKVDRTPLHLAAYEGHHLMAQLLLSYGAEVDSRDMLKMTPLHWAVEREHAEVMQILLENGADPNAISKFNKTPIALAMEHERLDFIDILQQEREVVNICPIRAAEIETATQNLIQLEAEELNQEAQIEYELPQTIKPQYAPTNKKQKMIFQQIKVQPVNEITEVKEEFQRLQDKVLHGIGKKFKNVTNFTEIEQPIRFLQAHGITMIPVDNDSTIVENAMESGQTVVLTEAGKLALNLTKTNNAQTLKRLQQLSAKKGTNRKVITIRADQLLGQNSTTLTSRGPNILKRNSNDQKNTGKIFFTSLGNAANSITKNITPVKKATLAKSEPIFLLNNDFQQVYEEDFNKEPVMDLADLHHKYTEARKAADELRKKFQEKEAEAARYQQQIRQMQIRQLNSNLK